MPFCRFGQIKDLYLITKVLEKVLEQSLHRIRPAITTVNVLFITVRVRVINLSARTWLRIVFPHIP